MQLDITGINVIRNLLEDGRRNTTAVLIPSPRILDQYHRRIFRAVRGEITDKGSDVTPGVAAVLENLRRSGFARDAIMSTPDVSRRPFFHHPFQQATELLQGGRRTD